MTTPIGLGIVELFAGAAGLAQGFLRAGGYDLLALTDWDENARRAFNLNYPRIPYICRDIDDLQPEELVEAAGGERIVGLLGGPPCQGFSLAGLRKRGDDRNRLVAAYARFVKALAPDFLVMENVPQLLFHNRFRELRRELSESYRLSAAILNAARYGAPQTRHRAVVLALHKRLGIEPTFPAPTHGFVERPAFGYRRFALIEPPGTPADHIEVFGADPVVAREIADARVTFAEPLGCERPLLTVEDAISDLALNGGKGAASYATPPATPYQKLLRSDKAENHKPRAHSPQMRELIAWIPEGGDLRHAPERLWPRSHYSQAYGRLHRRGLARTITTFFLNPGSGRFLHYGAARAITVREAARLQGFSDSFQFTGTDAQQMALVGNAVPLPLAEAIGRHVLRLLGARREAAAD